MCLYKEKGRWGGNHSYLCLICVVNEEWGLEFNSKVRAGGCSGAPTQFKERAGERK